MEDPKHELKLLAERAVLSPLHEKAAIVQRIYSPEAVLDHPLGLWKGRDELLQLYSFWRSANRALDFHVRDVGAYRIRTLFVFNDVLCPMPELHMPLLRLLNIEICPNLPQREFQEVVLH